MTLYKYVPPERIDILKNNRIRFTPASVLNDPFEMKPIIPGIASDDEILRIYRENFDGQLEKEISPLLSVDQFAMLKEWAKAGLNDESSTFRRNLNFIVMALNRVATREILKLFDDQREAIGILSLSKVETDLLMWAHYAKAHQGFVIALDETHPSLNAPRGEFHHPRCVDYLSERPTPYLADMDATKWLLTKSTGWKHEQEWRVLKPVADGDFANDGSGNKIHGMFDLPSEAIEGIIIGARADETLRKELKNLIHADLRYGHAWISQAVLSRASFDLEIKPLPSSVPVSRMPESFNLQVTASNVDEEAARAMGAAILAIARSPHLWPLDLESIKQVIIVDNIEDAVRTMFDIQPNTSVEKYYVIGKLNKCFETCLVLEKHIIEECLNDDLIEGNNLAFYAVRRALAHTHDLAQRYRMFSNRDIWFPGDCARGYLVNIVKRIWTHFLIGYATLETAEIASLKSRVKALVIRNEKIQETAEQSIVRYRIHGNLDELLRDIMPPIGELFDQIGEIHGLLHASGKSLKDITDGEWPFGSAHVSFVDDSGHMLREMMDYYPAWISTSVYEPLFDILELYLYTVGIGFHDTEDGVHIAVPWAAKY